MKKRITVLLAVSFIVALLSGCCLAHEWKEATCVTPKTCVECGETEGEATGHKWWDATCVDPQKCNICGEIGGNALGHKWVEATCSEAKFCEACGVVEGRPLDHDWTEGTETTPRICRACEVMEPLPMPASGEVFIGKGAYCTSTLTVHSATTRSCYIKLKNADREDVYSFFVPAGQTVVAPVPGGHYYVYFSYGTEWYGPEYLFGSDTIYSKDDELTDYVNYTWEYNLAPSLDGNFTETPVDAAEF